MKTQRRTKNSGKTQKEREYFLVYIKIVEDKKHVKYAFIINKIKYYVVKSRLESQHSPTLISDLT